MSEEFPPANERRAAQRVFLMNGVRVGSIVMLMAGLAMTRGVIEGFPAIAGYVLSVAGMLGFFFGPYWMVRHWKRQEREDGGS
ncbi:MAG: hypothetical protein AAGL68_08130 [Pseudomonadota bacterium]